MKTVKQREANREALRSAAALIEDMDFTQLFGDFGADDDDNNGDVLDKAQRNAVRRIRAMVKDTP